MPRIVHFELSAADLDRAQQFYADLFGWTFNKWEGPNGFVYVMVNTGPDDQPGINGGLLQRAPGPPAGATIMLELVESIDDYTAQITAAGGHIAVPKFPRRRLRRLLPRPRRQPHRPISIRHHRRLTRACYTVIPVKTGIQNPN